MEAVLLHGSWDNHKSHVKNPEKFHQPFVSRSYNYSLFPSNNFHSMGFLQTPPLFLPHHHLRPPPQPPLLPLPAAHPRLAITGRALSLPPANKNSNRTRGNSLTPKRSKSPRKNLKKQEIKKSAKLVRSQVAIVSSSSSGPSNITTDNARDVKAVENIEIINHVDFWGSKIFTASPSPSSLPLPTFCLRPKLKCSAAAASGVDTGATDNLRRLLQLQ